ncbi:MAG: acyl-CoA dehydratase activase-related protein, partial [Chloroflexota bacterium]
LMVYDYAPLLIGFLNALDAKVVLSSKTTREIMEQSGELSYTDSCFPVKLLHGHAAALSSADYVLYPCAIRLGRRDGDENQKFACPLVQASPFIIRQALNLGERMLIPIIDFSRGDTETIDSLAEVAVKMGFSRKQGRTAAQAGLEAQQRFEAGSAAAGEKLLKQLREGNDLGVVILARSYLSQDSGANLGIAEKLAQLGVVPIPLDFLPLVSVDPKTYSDRPYWSYEGKFISAAAIAAADRQLFGLALTNFGCGPNSFILRLLEDIMGGKPLGQLEIDEHAAEAGLVTRLEAYVDTIKSYASSTRPESRRKYVYRGTSSPIASNHKTYLLPRMATYVEIIAAAMEASGGRVTVLPEPDERNLMYSNQVTSGTECLPYRVTLGDFMRYYYENGSKPGNVEGLMAGSFGPCRFGKYSMEQMRALRDIGFDITIRTTVSNNGYRDFNAGPDFERLAWKGIVALDFMDKLLWRTRPYEKASGAADNLFAQSLDRLLKHIHRKEDCADMLRRTTSEFKALIDPGQPRRPVVGINGEIYLRSNRFSNNDLVRVCEEAGLEVVVSPVAEWVRYVSTRNVEDAIKYRQLKQLIAAHIRRFVRERDEHIVAKNFRELLEAKEPTPEEILARSRQYLSPKCGSEAVLSIGSAIEWMERAEFAGIISVMPHGCMPGGIVAAMSDSLSAMYHKPWISLTYDGFAESNNLTKISEFAELVRFCRQEIGKPETRTA